mmetsp:Transcript_26603/g.42767  ORF Transcript_26603/g.42767 Transcript_26603/m.42767 type:complete len:542 (+) Transcript_26603:138-1763(+)
MLAQALGRRWKHRVCRRWISSFYPPVLFLQTHATAIATDIIPRPPMRQLHHSLPSSRRDVANVTFHLPPRKRWSTGYTHARNKSTLVSDATGKKGWDENARELKKHLRERFMGNASELNECLRRIGELPEESLQALFRSLAESGSLVELISMRQALKKRAFLKSLLKEERSQSEKELKSLFHRLGNELLASFQLLFNEHTLTIKRVPPLVYKKRQIHRIIEETERVHPITFQRPLKHRVQDGSHRRIYGLYHPKAHQDYIISFVSVALCNDIPANIEEILGNERQEEGASSHCIFYSISSIRDGLSGVSVGKILLAKVMAQLHSELPQATTFATLSPIPSFKKWLREEVKGDNKHGSISISEIATKSECEQLSLALKPEDKQKGLDAAFHKLISPSHSVWVRDNTRRRNKKLREAMQPILLRLLARYLLTAKKPENTTKMLDKVGNFHVGNGAEVHRIVCFANTSDKAMNESLGCMVSYRYNTDARVRESNVQEYHKNGRVVASDTVIASLNKGTDENGSGDDVGEDFWWQQQQQLPVSKL